MTWILNKYLSQWNLLEALDDKKWEDENSDDGNSKADIHEETCAINILKDR